MADPRVHIIGLDLVENGAVVPLPAGTRANFRGRAHTVNTNGPAGGKWFWVPAENLPADTYVIQILVPRADQLWHFEVIVDLLGRLVHDPGFGEPLSPSSPPLTIRVRLLRPGDFQSHCFLALDCLEDGTSHNVGGHLFVGDHLLTSGPAPGVPASLEKYYRGVLSPGEYALRLEHPRYVLPPATPAMKLESTLVSKRVSVTLVPGSLTNLEIRGTSFYADRDQILELHTNVPSASTGEVQWQSSQPSVLTPELTGGRFRALASGASDVTARYRGLVATASVFVRSDPNQALVPSPDPASVIADPWAGTRVVKGEILCAFKSTTTAAQRDALLSEFQLSRVGVVPLANTYQLRYDTNHWTLPALIEKLNADARVEVACPHALMEWASEPLHVPSYLPSEAAPYPSSHWHLQHTEAFPAFGLMRTLQRAPQTIVFCDSGLYVSPSGRFHVDLHTRVKLFASTYFEHLAALVNASKPEHLAEPFISSDFHGTKVISVAAAQWDNGAAIGVDTDVGIILLKCSESSLMFCSASHLNAALSHAASGGIGTDIRVVNLTLNIVTASFLIGLYNRLFTNPIRKIIDQGGLVVIAAGNHNRPIRDVVIASLKAVLEPRYQDGVIVVSGTERRTDFPRSVDERRLGDGTTEEGTNYDPPGPALIDIAAPGAGIHVSVANDEAGIDHGTSFSAPFVSGAAAILFSVLPKESAKTIKDILIKTSDPIEKVTGAVPSPPPRLWTSADKFIGYGRVNVWQALLNALNRKAQAAGSGTRYVGLRVATQVAKLQLHLEYENAPSELIEKSSMPTSPNPYEATRVTLTNLKPKAFPKALRAEREQADHTFKPVYRRTLRLDAARIDALAPRYVTTCRAFLDGGVTLRKIDRGPLPPNRAQLTVENTGKAPTDLELLDPQKRTPEDKSLRPWMKLANGDSYALTHKIVEGPANLGVRFLDANLQPLPPAQIDDEGHPYVTVPFGSAPRVVHLDCDFPPPPAAQHATVTAEVFSLNNELIRDSHPVGVSATAEQITEMTCAPGWIFDASNTFGPPSTGGSAVSCTCDPASWTCQTHFGLDGKAATEPKQPGGGGVVVPITLLFESPRTTPAGTAGQCTLWFGAKPYRFNGRLLLPNVEWTCDEPHANSVEVAGGVVRASFAVKLTNRSGFAVHVKGFASEDALFPAHAPAGVDVKIALKPGSVNAPPVSELPLFPGQQVSGMVTIFYAPSVLTLAPETVGTRRIRVFSRDPLRPPPDADAAPRYLSRELVVTAVLRPPTPPPA